MIGETEVGNAVEQPIRDSRSKGNKMGKSFLWSPHFYGSSGF